jgi:hypothetical protein
MAEPLHSESTAIGSRPPLNGFKNYALNLTNYFR